jgi:AraC-like DNA-binding protein
MAYDFLQPIPNVSIGLIENRRIHPAGTGPTAWSRSYSHRPWTFDYCSFEGLRISLESPSLKLPPFKRSAGSWHLYAPGMSYREQMQRQELNVEALWMFFTLRGRFAPISGRPLTVILDPQERLVERVRTMYAIQNSGRPGSELAVHGLLLFILADIRAAAAGGGTGDPDSPFVLRNSEPLASAESALLLQRVDHIAERRINNLPSLDELAEILGMSVSSLMHRYRAETGMTVIDRFRWLRIREARRLLAQPGATVKTVAGKLNFSSPFYFSRVFSEVTRMSPQTYIRQLKG